jgi:hypothetical protein
MSAALRAQRSLGASYRSPGNEGGAPLPLPGCQDTTPVRGDAPSARVVTPDQKVVAEPPARMVPGQAPIR